MQPRLVYDSEEVLACRFLALVVRNRALKSCYPGGQSGFLKRHLALSNRSITISAWLDDDFNEVIAELNASGMAAGRDFTLVDVFDHEWELMFRPDRQEVPHDVDLKVSWLRGRYCNGAIYVRAACEENQNPSDDRVAEPAACLPRI